MGEDEKSEVQFIEQIFFSRKYKSDAGTGNWTLWKTSSNTAETAHKEQWQRNMIEKLRD